MNSKADLNPPQKGVLTGSNLREAANRDEPANAGAFQNIFSTGNSFRTVNRAYMVLGLAGMAALILPFTVLAQLPDSTKAGHYIEIGTGIGPSVYRDKATSPLFYRGVSLYGTLNLIRVTGRKETLLGIEMTPGVTTAQAGEAEAVGSLFNSVSFSHSRLYQLPGRSDDRWNYKLGARAIATGNLRLNEELRNNSVGLEAFANLMAAFKISRDVSRLREEHKKLAFINYRLKPKRRNLSYQLNIGIWNNSLRNGYAYLDHSGVVNDPKVFGDYNLRVFSGMRFSSELNYTLHLTGAHKNAVRFSYVWDALSTPHGPDAFDMARHIVRFTLLYNTK